MAYHFKKVLGLAESLLPGLRAFAAFAFYVAAPLLACGPAWAEQLWISQSASFPAAAALRLNFSNTLYTEHGEHFANEEAASFRWRFATNWSAGAGITFGQSRREVETGPEGEGAIRHHWDFSGRPSENVSLDWLATYGGWTFFNAQRIDLYFREGERDWPVYRNIGSVTAPPSVGLPWRPRPYLTEQVYFSGRECFAGGRRFCQFRFGGGLRLQPCERLFVSVYWQYRNIERPEGNWESFRVAGLSTSLFF